MDARLSNLTLDPQYDARDEETELNVSPEVSLKVSGSRASLHLETGSQPLQDADGEDSGALRGFLHLSPRMSITAPPSYPPPNRRPSLAESPCSRPPPPPFMRPTESHTMRVPIPCSCIIGCALPWQGLIQA